MSTLTEAVINELIDNSNPQYTDRELALRQTFVKEYCVDYDKVKAAIRCGFAKSFAEDYATRFMEEPYVHQLIKKLESEQETSDCPSDDTARSIIKSGLFREANFTGNGSSHSARVSALANLAKIHGMEAPTKVEQTTTHKGCVMLVPAVASIAEYEKMAIASQAKLIQHAAD